MEVWKITPVVPADDERWLGHRPVAAAYVAADTPAEARLVAARSDMSADEGKVGNESGHLHSRFSDEKLYRVDRAPADEVAGLAPLPERPAVIDWH